MVRAVSLAAWVLVALAASAKAQQASKPSGPVVNPLTDSNIYPIAVWAMGSRTAQAFADLGVNIFVGGEGEAVAWCDELAKSKCVGFVGWRRRPPEQLAAIAKSPGFLGWMHGDEPDNPGDVNGEFRSTRIPPSELIARYQEMKASAAPAPMYLNLGQGLANANWQSTPDEVYKEFMKSADIVCYDIYPTTTQPRGEDRLLLVARGISRLKAFAGQSRPAWIWLECTNMGADRADVGERAPAPHELRAEVWMSILHGADGIGYFPHQFNPYKGGPAAIPQELQKEMKLTDSLLHKLAPVLRTGKKQVLKTSAGPALPLAPALPRGSVSRVDAAMWTHATGTLVLAVNMKNAPSKAAITLPAGDKSGAFKVVGQDRSVQPAGGVISDDFQPYEVRLYWTGPQTAGLSYAYPAPPPPAAIQPVAVGKLADLPAQADRKALAWSRTHCTRFVVPALAEAPALDGKLDDKAWGGAMKLLNWSNVGGTGVVAHQTAGWIGQHGGKIYLAFRCQEPSLDKLVTGKKAGWQNDCIEIWFDPTNTRTSYSHIVVSADGQIEASRTIPDEWDEAQRDDGWKPAIQVKTGREEGAWTLEAAFDIKDLQVGGLPSSIWGFNVARERKPDPAENSMYCSGGFNKSFRFAEMSLAASGISLSNGVLANRSDKPVTAEVQVLLCEKRPGIVFAEWEAKWLDRARDSTSVSLAPGQEMNLLESAIGQKVPSGGRVRLTAMESKGLALMEEFIANPPPANQPK